LFRSVIRVHEQTMTRLTHFFVASALLHSLLLVAGSDLARIDAGAAREIISVSLDAERINIAAKRTRTTTAHPLPVTMASSAASSWANANDSSTLPETDTAGRSEQDATARVRARVFSDMAQYFYYPPIARMRAWEGRVLLAFRVEQDGLLHAPRLVHTSGYGVLDEAALNSLRKVVRVADAGGPRLDMEIPVVFRLTDAR
jgi:TonB family protein